MPADPYTPHEEDEHALRVALYGAGIGGVLGYLRGRLPTFFDRVHVGRLIRRNPGAITSSAWYIEAWEAFEARISTRLVSLSRSAASRTIRTLSAKAAAGISTRLAEDFARTYAAEVAAFHRTTTAAGIKEAARVLAQREGSISSLAQQLGERIGPTPRQLRRIHAGEAKRIADGVMTRKQIRRWIKRSAGKASLARAKMFASDAVVRQVSESRRAVFEEAGLLIYSANVGDDRVRDLHRAQTAVTRANPTPAGLPWAAGAPFSGLPPYEIGCRCWPERISEP